MAITEVETKVHLLEEAPLEPELPICDPHHHFWKNPRQHLFDRYMLEDLLEDTGAGHLIMETVYIECQSEYREGGPEEMRPVGEIEFVTGIAEQNAAGKGKETRVAAGIVGFAELTLGQAVAPVLEALVSAGKGRLRGIRRACTYDPVLRAREKAPGLLLTPKFQEGFANLKKYNLSFDSWQFFHQLNDVAMLAKSFPDTPIIVNHIGAPLGVGPYAGKSEEVFREWKRGILALAAQPNVTMKLGGVGMEQYGYGWKERVNKPGSMEIASAFKPYFDFCIEQFGVGCCMFESNFPVDKASYSYTALWNAFKHYCKDFSPRERSALLRDNALRVYRLEE